MKRGWKVLLSLAAVMLAVGALWQNSQNGNSGETKTSSLVAVPAPLTSQDYVANLAISDQTITRLKAGGRNGDWIDLESLSTAYLGRARFTGSFDDIVAARAATDRGIAMAVKGSGPLLARAAASLTSHNYAAALPDLDAVDRFVVPDVSTRADAKAMRGDVAAARGDYAKATALFEQAGQIERWPGLPYRKAVLARQMGRMEEARVLFRAADGLNRNPTPAFRSETLSRLAELDLGQGKWPEATKGFSEANKVFPGYWRTEMRLAQMRALGGKMASAIAEYERIAKSTDAPEPMDILAGLYRAQGNAPASKAWAAMAGAIWQTRLKQLPEAAWGHAAEHELAFGNPRTALELAGKNARNRPNGAALILLAKAWIANGRADHALALCSKVDQSGWVSTELWVTKAEALSLLGRGDEAQAAQAQAQKLNPHALERTPAFGWLDH